MQAASRRLKVCVIGAGVVGCATASTLSLAGHDVLLVDAAPGPATLASQVDGAQLSYWDVEPLATPALRSRLFGLLSDPESPLSWRFGGGWSHLRWGVDFLRACRPAPVARAMRALLALGLLSRDELLSRQANDPLELAVSPRGKLTVYSNAQDLDAAAHRLAWLREMGSEQSLLRPEECLALEPTLGSMRHHLLGGLWTPGEATLDSVQFSQAMSRQVVATGGHLRTRTRALAFARQGERIVAVQTDTGDIACDAVVMATGSQSAKLARTLGLRLPVAPVRSHSITLPIRHPELAPAVAVRDAARRMVFTPLSGHLRVSGTLDWVGHDQRRDPHRVRMLLQAARELFPDSCEFTADPQAWAGLRAETPTGLPIIGPSPVSNLWLNTGHGDLGVTLALGSARLVERWIAGDVNPALASPFLLSR